MSQNRRRDRAGQILCVPGTTAPELARPLASLAGRVFTLENPSKQQEEPFAGKAAFCRAEVQVLETGVMLHFYGPPEAPVKMQSLRIPIAPQVVAGETTTGGGTTTTYQAGIVVPCGWSVDET